MSIWQPIETAPKDGTRILLFVPPDIEFGRWVSYEPGWFMNDTQCGGDVGCEPTHWMPIPEPPK